MTTIKNPLKAYENARKAFRIWNTGRKDPNDSGFGALLRTSTKTGGAGVAVATLLGVVTEYFPSFEPLLSDPQVTAGLTVTVMYVVARLSKTPTTVGKL